MIRIDKFTRGRLGNKIFHYSNLMQVSSALGTEASCVRWEGQKLFVSVEKKKRDRKPNILLSWRECLEQGFLANLDPRLSYSLDGSCLHNIFFEVAHRDPREFLVVRAPRRTPQAKISTKVSIHVRGGDTLGPDGNNGREFHPVEYYNRAVDMVLEDFANCSFFVASDDPACEVFRSVVRFLEHREVRFQLGNPKGANGDFKELAYSDVAISSSSTFSVAANMFGTRDKMVIHSAEWIMKNQLGPSYVPWGKISEKYPIEYWNAFDRFWVRLGAGEASFYPTLKLV